jgi:hypothetical protein
MNKKLKKVAAKHRKAVKKSKDKIKLLKSKAKEKEKAKAETPAAE